MPENYYEGIDYVVHISTNVGTGCEHFTKFRTSFIIIKYYG